MITNKKIRALGFVEVIIAIVVVGIMSSVFLTISGRAMKELVQTERLETMKRVARDGAQIAQEIANRQKNAMPGEEYFPIDGEDYCYIPVKSDEEYFFQGNQGGLGEYERNSIIQVASPDTDPLRDWAKEYAVYQNFEEASDYFLIMCITDIDTSGTRWANVYFLVGDIHVKGQKSSDTDMKDFKYYAIIDL